MVSDAEKFRSEDEAQRACIEARNKLENYAFSVKSAVRDCEDKMTSEDKDKANREVDEALKWLDTNQLAEKEEFEHKLEQLQKACSPIMAKLHGGQQQQQQQQQGAAHSHASGGQGGPTIEEMD